MIKKLILLLLVPLGLSAQVYLDPYGIGVNAGSGIPSIVIGTQTWMKENLKVTKFSDGTDIPLVEDDAAWAATTTPARCAYHDSTKYSDDNYKYLYNHYAITDAKGLCPTGWHIPTETEWTTLFNYLGGVSVAGGALKEPGLSHWKTPNTVGADSGMHMVGGGLRAFSGSDINITSYGYYVAPGGRYFYLSYSATTINGYYTLSDYREAHSVRCIKD